MTMHTCTRLPLLRGLVLLFTVALLLGKTSAQEELSTTTDNNSSFFSNVVIDGNAAFATAAAAGDLPTLLKQRNITQYTVIVPSDLAIARDVGETEVSRLLNPTWKPHLEDLLLYHVLEGKQKYLLQRLEQSGTLTASTVQGSNITIQGEDFTADITNAQFIQNTGQAYEQDGILFYFTNRVYLPTSMTKSLRELVEGNQRQFSTLFEILQLVNLEQPLSKTGPVTLFAPTNEAWDALDQEALLSSLLLPTYRTELLELLSRHVVWEENHAKSSWAIGDEIEVLMENESLTVTSLNPTILNDNVTIISADILATNGVLQVVDTVILPIGFELEPRVASSSAVAWAAAAAAGLKTEAAKRRLNVVALGDSYIAGNGARNPDGIRDYTNALCFRSDSSWAGLYAKCVAEKNVDEKINVQFANHACSGSQIADIYQKQLSGITRRTDLVLVSIGANDVGFLDLVPSCYVQGNPRKCKELIEESITLMRGDLQDKIAKVLVDIRAAGHNGTKIVLAGAPYFGNDIDYEIYDESNITITYSVGRRIYAAGDLFEQVQKQAVAEANRMAGDDFAVFESVKSLFRRKEFDARPEMVNADSWIIGFDPSGTFGFQEENFHYNPQGHAELGNYLCTRSTYGASQRVAEPDEDFSKSGLLIALFTILAVSLVSLVLLTYIISRRGAVPGKESQCAKTWSGTIHRVHQPIKRAMKATARLASTNPKVCIAIGIFVSLALLGCGFATNFHIVSEQNALWTPIGSQSESEGTWVDLMLPNWSNATTSISERDGGDVLLTLIVHKKGENMVTNDGTDKMFEALDAVRNTPGYSDFCGMHGVESLCPSGYEYICRLYSIPTEAVEAKDCPIVGVTGFWFHNRSLYEEQVSSDADVSDSMSLEVFFGDDLNLEDVLGYPVYEDGLLVSSTAFLNFVLFPKDADGVEDLRKNVVQTMLNLQEEWEDEEFEIQFLTTGSFPDEFVRAIGNDIVLFPVVFIVMALFTFVAFARRDATKSRGALGLGAVFTVLLSILTGYGILFSIGVPLTSLTQVLPFVIFGIGLDDSFLLKNAYERMDSSKAAVDRVDDAIEEVGISIAMTSITSSLAFALGCFSSIPSVRWLCLYGFTTILVDFIYQITIFLALLVLDEERIKASRRDVLCCFSIRNSGNTDAEREPTTVGGKPGIMVRYSRLLLRPTAKAIIVVAFSALFSVCAIATTRLELGFDFTSVLPADSYVIKFSTDLDNYSQRRINADVYFRNVDQGDSSVQEQMKLYVNELVDGVDAIAGPPASFWLTDYQDYLHEQDGDLDGMPFNETLRRFLDDPRFNYDASIILDESGEIVASRSKISFGNLDVEDGNQVLSAMKGQSKVSVEQGINARQSTSAFFSFNAVYYLWDFLIETESELKMTTIIGVASVSVMSLIFLPHWSGILFVLPMIISLYVDMMGILQLAGIDINGVSFVSIVMSLGLYVDYILHVLLCYYESTGQSRGERVTQLLSTVGVSVLLGGFSTLFGTLPLAFTSSEVFYTVFIAFLAIVALGLSHGLILLPVLLSLVGPLELVAAEKAANSQTLALAEQKAPDDAEALCLEEVTEAVM